MDNNFILKVLLSSFIFQIIGIESLILKELKVPDIVEYGSEDELILDCDYDLGNDDEGLVVKWFYGDTEQIYQWIPKNKPQESGRLKGKLNLDYKASDDLNEMYRALNIIDVEPQLSGNYTCVVSTFVNEVREMKQMIIYDREDDFNLTYEQIDDDTLKITCSASNVYPKPNITIYANKPDLSSEIENVTLSEEDDLWDISTSILVDLDDDNDDDSTETFVCELKIPEANYTAVKELYFSSQDTTENTSSSSEMSLQIADVSANYESGGNLKCSCTTFIIIALFFVLFTTNINQQFIIYA